MYIPAYFKEENVESLHSLIQAYNFATLITIDNGIPFATHLPFMLDGARGQQGTLIAHMARANPQWQHFTTVTEVLVIFQGPHTYISPSSYKSEFGVPTWNYAVVHVYGRPRLIEDQLEIQQVLERLVDQHEAPRAQPWTFDWSDRHVNLTKAIVAFEIVITRLEGKLKLGQNRSLEDQAGMINDLRSSSSRADQAVAKLMVANGQPISRK